MHMLARNGRIRSINMIRTIAIVVFAYIICICFAFLSEITYKHRKIKDVINDYKRIITNSTIIFAIFIISSIIYYMLGFRPD